MKRYKPLKLAFLLLPLVWGFACSSPSTTSNRPDLFGNVDQSLTNGDEPIVYFEPPEGDGGSDVEAPAGGGDVVADPAPETSDPETPDSETPDSEAPDSVSLPTDFCDQPLEVKPWRVIKKDGYSSNDRKDDIRSNKQEKSEVSSGDFNTDVDLGTKYHIVFQAEGAEGPYQWSFASKVGPKLLPGPECDVLDVKIPLPFGGEIDLAPPSCSKDLLTTNENWREVLPGDEEWVGPENISEEDLANKVYIQLSTDFSFPGKVLPYSAALDYLVYDQLEVTAESSVCSAETSLKEKKAYSLNHILKLPYESPEEIQCVQEIGYISDVGKSSNMKTTFKRGSEKIASIIYADLVECAKDNRKCEGPRKTSEFYATAPAGFVNAIDRVELVFEDYFHSTGCKINYDLIRLTCTTPYRIFHYGDPKKIEDDLVCMSGNVLGWTSNLWGITPIPLPTESIWRPRSRPHYPSD